MSSIELVPDLVRNSTTLKIYSIEVENSCSILNNLLIDECTIICELRRREPSWTARTKPQAEGLGIRISVAWDWTLENRLDIGDPEVVRVGGISALVDLSDRLVIWHIGSEGYVLLVKVSSSPVVRGADVGHGVEILLRIVAILHPAQVW